MPDPEIAAECPLSDITRSGTSEASGGPSMSERECFRCGHAHMLHSKYGCSVCGADCSGLVPGALVEFDGFRWWGRCAWCLTMSGPWETIDEAQAWASHHDDEAGH